jgi:serine/threonine-protein kinase HipA
MFTDFVGTLAQSEGRLTFRYTPGWLRNPDAIALSCSLPL